MPARIYEQIGHDLCSNKYNFSQIHSWQKSIIDDTYMNQKLGLRNLIKLIRLNLPMECDRMQSKITKLDNFIVFEHNFFCPDIMLGYVD